MVNPINVPIDNTVKVDNSCNNCKCFFWPFKKNSNVKQLDTEEKVTETFKETVTEKKTTKHRSSSQSS